MLRQAFVVVLLSAVAYLIYHIYFFFGYHLHYFNHKPGHCQYVNGLDFGSENFKTTSTGAVFITSGVTAAGAPPLFKKFILDNGLTKGRIFLYDFNQPSLGAVSLKILPSSNFNHSMFHPHGIDVLEDKVNGEHLLYVVSHADDHTERVEKFRFNPKPKTLQHIKTFQYEIFTGLNDVAVISEDKFYVSNFVHFRNPVGILIEHLFQMSLGSLVLVDGEKRNTVVGERNGPNGITLSKDGRFLYVCEFHSRLISVWSVKSPGVLDLVQQVPVQTSPDNLHLSSDETELYIGAHPVFHEFFFHGLDPRKPAPSSVLRMPLKDRLIVEDKIEELYYDDGRFQSGSTMANVYKGKLLIGTILNKLVVCDVNK